MAQIALNLGALNLGALNLGALNPGTLLTRESNKCAIKLTPALPLKVDAADVQGLLFRGYGSLLAASYLLLAFHDDARARAWLGAVRGKVSDGRPAPRTRALHVAFTHGGLGALGLSARALAGFSRAFSMTMTDPHTSAFLGDTGESAPEYWDWGGPKTPALHAVLMLFAENTTELAALEQEQRASLEAAGIEVLRALYAKDLGGAEHFGFADGISQPAIEGYHESASRLHRVKPGEFLLGYVNEYGLFTERPLLDARDDPFARLPLDVEGSPCHDLGRNGTYLVFRQLRQDVALFRRTLEALTRRPDGTPDPAARAALAARMVGRWPSGAPLVEAPDRDDFSKAEDNEFGYHASDPNGVRCPIGAHVRRANPRDSLAPQPGTEASLGVNRRHRLIRRGRSYGPPLAEGTVDGVERGLFFIALNANIARQYEFVQHAWVNDPRFNGLFQEADPLVGATHDNQFTIERDASPERYVGLPRFVSVAGGAYLFMPGLRALRFLSELPG
jgi:Dyp-type peroxidase family